MGVPCATETNDWSRIVTDRLVGDVVGIGVDVVIELVVILDLVAGIGVDVVIELVMILGSVVGIGVDVVAELVVILDSVAGIDVDAVIELVMILGAVVGIGVDVVIELVMILGAVVGIGVDVAIELAILRLVIALKIAVPLLYVADILASVSARACLVIGSSGAIRVADVLVSKAADDAPDIGAFATINNAILEIVTVSASSGHLVVEGLSGDIVGVDAEILVPASSEQRVSCCRSPSCC